MKGYASITFIVIVFIGLTITIAATTVLMLNALGTTKLERGLVAYDLAESGIENGILMFLRDPINYNGETTITENGTITTAVSGDRTSISSTGVSGNYQRTILVELDYVFDLELNSWQETY